MRHLWLLLLIAGGSVQFPGKNRLSHLLRQASLVIKKKQLGQQINLHSIRNLYVQWIFFLFWEHMRAL